MILAKILVRALLLCVSIVYFSNINAQSPVPSKGLKTITPEKFKSHIDFLASDALLGRNTPSPGQDTAAAYITREFIKYGLAPVNGSYANPVPLVTTTLGDENYVEINNRGERISLKIKSEFIPFEISSNSIAEGSLVFAGYGITAPEIAYDDYKGINVIGKIVVVMRHSPGESVSSSVFSRDDSKYGTVTYKMENAIKHGAIGVLVLTDPLNHMIISPKGFPWPKLYSNFPQDANSLTLKDTINKKLPVIHVGQEVINLLFGDVDSLKKVETEIDTKLKPLSHEFPDIRVKIKASVIENQVKANNIVGLLPGTDPVLKNEIVVIGAHYDHVGFKRQHKPYERYIYNGADDNASGTTGLLCVAEAFGKSKQKTKRSILFIAFTGEEKGLFGSLAYVRNPLFPLEKTVAMLNMDMISRGHPDTVHFEAGTLSPALTEIAKKENENIGFKVLVDGLEFLDRSDQSSFYHKNVPFIMFFAGLHDDYHTVRDRPETIDTIKAAKIAKLVFKTAWVLSNDNKHYNLLKTND